MDAIKIPEIFEVGKDLVKMSSYRDFHPKFKINMEKELINILDWREKTFLSLADLSSPQLSRFAIYSSTQAAFSEIRYPVVSAWREHIPFMFAIINLLKPRRFVELGVHNGASFLAACQEIEKLHSPSECVAIDTWEGDPHAGRYDESVFAHFLKKLDSYRAFAGYLRMQFDEAVGRFEDGSIDLLHIDGLHTAAAVAHDFQLWKSKLSSQGVVLFHDINEFRSDFGVWRVWRELKEKYPYIEFGHGHGLGVLIVGEESLLRQSVEGWGRSLTEPGTQELLQILFGNIGKIASVRSMAGPATSPSAGEDSPNPSQNQRRGLRKIFWKVKRSIRKKR